MTKAEYKHQWYLNHKQECLERSKQWEKDHPKERMATVLARRKKTRAALESIFGGKCNHCGSVQYLEFAHKEDTPILTMFHVLNNPTHSRGQDSVYADIKRHLDKYLLLCRPCHRKFDSHWGGK